MLELAVSQHLAVLGAGFVVQHLAAIGAAFLVLATGGILARLPRGGNLTISELVAQRRWSTVAFGVTLVITTVAEGVFFLGWFGPRYDLGGRFRGLVMALVALMIVLAACPCRGSTQAAHNWAARALSLLGVVLLLDVTLEGWGRFGGPAKVSSVAALTCGIGLMLVYPRLRRARWRGPIEAFSIGLFGAAILVLTYVS